MSFLKNLIQQLLPASPPIPVNERRQSVRLSLDIDVTVQVGELLHPAHMVNLTFTGLCLELETTLREGQEVTLLRGDFGPPFNATVVWSKPSPRGQGYLIGVECELDEDRLCESWLEPALIQAGFQTDFVDTKREFLRVPGRVNCELTMDGGKIEGQMMDLSIGGALVECDSELTTGSVFDFKTRPLGGLPPLLGTAEVVSVRSQGGRWSCGLKFSYIHREDVQKYMGSMMSSSS